MLKICFYVVTPTASTRLHPALHNHSGQTIQKHHPLNSLILNVKNTAIPKIRTCRNTVSGNNMIFICFTNVKYIIWIHILIIKNSHSRNIVPVPSIIIFHFHREKIIIASHIKNRGISGKPSQKRNLFCFRPIKNI